MLFPLRVWNEGKVGTLIWSKADQYTNYFKRFTQIEGIVIRGHILVERQLIRAIEMSVEIPESLTQKNYYFQIKL